MAFAFLLISSPVDGNKDSDYFLISTEKRETALEPFPFQLIFVISSEVCFHHLLPGLVSESNVWFHCIIVFVTGEDHHHCFEITD